MPSELESRLGVYLTSDAATRIMAGSAHWPANFGTAIDDVRSLIVHLTAGWPARERVEEFVTRYIGPPDNPGNRRSAGVGPQYFIAGDGTVFRLIDMPSVTWHAFDPYNTWAIGVETANLGDVARPQFPIPANGDNRWRALGPDQHLDAADVPGMKLWLSTQRFREAVVSWWTTPAYSGPVRAPLGNPPWQLFSEGQYRSWALLARFLCEQYDLPRNFPLLPHALRNEQIDDVTVFRRIALADERFPMLVRALGGYNVQEAHFEAANIAQLQAAYTAAIRNRHVPAQRDERRNLIWLDMFTVYRGIHGHGFSGAHKLVSKEQPAGSGNFVLVNADHDCPGPLFDWHRFAREVWDWWWYPFDLSDDLARAVTTRRPESRASGSTPLVEYYFEARDFDAKDRAYALRTLHPTRLSRGIFDNVSSPSTFELDQGVPIYAPANGELIAARFPDPRHAVSLAFVLVRHEIFHQPDTLMIEIEGSGSVPAHPGRIDYNSPPSYVFSLIIHLGQPEGMSFTEVTAANPEWLNRVLLRKKECDLALARYDGDAQHGGVAQAAWDSRPPGSGTRPTPLESWRADQLLLQAFLDSLRAGDVALGTLSRWVPGATPIRVILGDFLGESGPTRREGSVDQYGIGMEVFASGFVPPTFASYMSTSGWDLPAGTPLRPPPAIFYQSEWAKTPADAERQRLVSIGVNPDLVPWWQTVALGTQLDPTLPPQARLNIDGWAFHVRPLEFMRWINDVTWASEWPKYRITDQNGAEVARPPRPRSRRV